MPLNTTVKVGPEVRLYISSSSQSLLSITPDGTAFENVGGTIVWDEVDFVRFPLDRAEPTEIVDIYKRFSIDHTKKGRQQRKTGSFTVAFQNTSKQLRRYNDRECMIRIAWHVEDAVAADEFEYYKSVRFTNLTRSVPDTEANERVEFVWATYGRRDGP